MSKIKVAHCFLQTLKLCSPSKPRMHSEARFFSFLLFLLQRNALFSLGIQHQMLRCPFASHIIISSADSGGHLQAKTFDSNTQVGSDRDDQDWAASYCRVEGVSDGLVACM